MEVLSWLGEKAVQFISGGFVNVCGALAAQTHVFTIVAIVGAYLIMVGNKEAGTKVTSTTLITYIILRVVGSL